MKSFAKGFFDVTCIGKIVLNQLSFSKTISVIALMGLGFLTDVSQAQVQIFTCPGEGFGPGAEPAIHMESLKTVPNPIFPPDETTGLPALRADLSEYIADPKAAIRLGKALFWDMQMGSDNKTACATCHFHAGADVRTMNQLNPGTNETFDVLPGPNAELQPGSFPITKNYDDIIGSQGVRKSDFLGIDESGAELTTPPTGFRLVTRRNAPTVINAVFNHRNFWDGRAQPDFNGVNPFGSRDTSVHVWVTHTGGTPVKVVINIQNASLASQAVGPLLSHAEMSAAGRTFPDVGKKALFLKPLRHQQVSPADSVLGAVADTPTGLKTTYASMIQDAFRPEWWNTWEKITVDGKSYSMMEANFSLFWGISIMLYEATLVSDDSPMDQYLATRTFDPLTGALTGNDPTLLDQTVRRLAEEGISITRADIIEGLALFELPVAPPPSFPIQSGSGVGCIGCHLGAETTSASVGNLSGMGNETEGRAFKGARFDLRMERMFMNMSWTPPGPLSSVPLEADAITFDPNTYAVNVTSKSKVTVPPIDLPVATYDTGWYDIGVRPIIDDTGLGGGLDGPDSGDTKPLSWTKFFQSLPDPTFIKIPGNSLGCCGTGTAVFPDQIVNKSGFPLLSGPLHKTEHANVAGAFKTSGLRNVELNGPYFHNGGKSTLMQVLDFYNAGGDFPNATTKAPAIVFLNLFGAQKSSLVAFMLALTDERVRWQRAPFDHPQLLVPHGDNLDGTDNMMDIPAVGAGGSAAPLKRFLDITPF